MQGSMLAVAIAVFGVIASWWIFGVRRRRQAETEAGVRSLANMKWRECVGLVLQWLHEEGYQEEHSTRQPGDGGTEFLLRKGDENVLLSYKHGTAYRIGEANVREFASAVQMQGAKDGILVTLGQAEDTAKHVARKYGIRLIDGDTLWPRLDKFVSPAMLATVRKDASARSGKGLWIGVLVSLVLAALAYVVLLSIAPAEAPSAAATPKREEAQVAVPEKSLAESEQDRITAEINERERAMAEVASLTDEQRMKRRAEAAAKLGGFSQVDTAGWSTQSTLVLRLNKTDGKDALLIDEVCRTLTQFEELRYTRVQLEPPLDSTVPVRWRQCQ